MLKYYQGPLGDFEYNDTEFRVFTYGVIKYIGKETDGTKIKIPAGITDCSFMFENCCKLQTVPVIPEGVRICNGMFVNCSSLQQAPEIPVTVKQCNFIFSECGFFYTPLLPQNTAGSFQGVFDSCCNLLNYVLIPYDKFDTMHRCQYAGCPVILREMHDFIIRIQERVK